MQLLMSSVRNITDINFIPPDLLGIEVCNAFEVDSVRVLLQEGFLFCRQVGVGELLVDLTQGRLEDVVLIPDMFEK